MVACKCKCILHSPLPIWAFQDQCNQTITNKYSNEHNNWQEAGGRRQEAGGRRQEAGGRRQEAGGRRQTSWLFTSAAEKLNSLLV